jgi:hypothetical protein
MATIVDIHLSPTTAYEVEFLKPEALTAVLVTLSPEQFQPAD